MRRSILLPGLALLGIGLGSAHADTSWRDIESRIQYGYYTEDERSLHNLASAAAADESRDKLRGYYAALANWRLSQLAARQGAAAARGAAAAELAQRCVHEADAALAVQEDFAAALALRAACEAAPPGGNAGYTVFGARRPRKDLERALALAPRDPRVLLIDAMNDYQLAPAAGGNKERALVKLRQAVTAFESERAGVEPLPGWGAAEAYFYLGSDLLDHKDPVGARDAVEHALLLAPEFTQARRLMARITSG